MVGAWLVVIAAATVPLAASSQATQPVEPTIGSPAEVDAKPESLVDDPRARRWRLTLLVGVLLLTILIAAALVLILFSRNFRRIFLRKAPEPTPYVDAWKMHRLPDDENPDVAPDESIWDDSSPPFGDRDDADDD